MVNYSLIDPTGVAEFLTEASKDVGDSNSMSTEVLNGDTDRLLRSKSSISAVPAIASILPTALLTQYTYTLLCHGVTRQRLLELTEEELKNTFHISDGIHRRKLLKAVQKASGLTRFDSYIQDSNSPSILDPLIQSFFNILIIITFDDLLNPSF